MKKIGVALLGLGVVGGGTYQILTTKRDYILKNEGIDIEVKAVLERNMDRVKELGIDESIVATSIDEIVANPEIQVVAEFFGGVEPAKSFLIKALESGKSIVTANKEMFSKSWVELERAGKKGGAGLYFEASCVGGVPIIRTLTDAMQGNKMTSLKGIVNGTTNYILSRMSDEGVDYNTCLKTAQELGYAEANPSADVDGFDSMYKNSILSSLAYKKRVPIDKIYREGISAVDVLDLELGRELGYTMKLLAISKNDGKMTEARVHPAFLPAEHPLSSVKGSFNAVFINGDNVDDVMLYGRGAGSLPTGSAIVSDIVFAGKNDSHRRFAFEECEADDSTFATDFVTEYYLRFVASNTGEALSKIVALIEASDVAVEKAITKGNNIVVITGKSKESCMQDIISRIKGLSSVDSLGALVRIEK
ncbi:MAG: homoserine dehydrogenase [Clostridia bacterium]|nr:homoserine dehydrogenase [Clostridia bacterium]